MSEGGTLSGPDAVVTAERILRAALGPRLRVSFPMARMTSFRLGGPAALYVEAQSDRDLTAASEAIRSTGPSAQWHSSSTGE